MINFKKLYGYGMAALYFYIKLLTHGIFLDEPNEYVNILNCQIYDYFGIFSSWTGFTIKNAYVFDNTEESIGLGNEMMIPVTGAYDRRPEKLEFNNFASEWGPDEDWSGDGLFWTDEIYRYGTDPYLNSDISVDTDGDGLTNQDEADEHGTDPLGPDTDGDGLTDDEEPTHNTHLLNPDTDFDGLDDGDEVNSQTDPLNPDTDGDGYLDGEDLHPLYDAVVKIHVNRAGVYSDSDSPDTISPGDFYLKARMDDEWNSNKWQHSKKPIKHDENYLQPNEFPSGDGITFVRNIPDNQRYIDIDIELWDDDTPGKEQMDLDGSSYHDKRLDLTYDAVDQSWDGDGITGMYPYYSRSNGKGDGGRWA